MKTKQITAQDLKKLTSTEYLKIKSSVEKQILENIGEKPRLEDFKRDNIETGNRLINILMFAIFISALLISGTHALQFGQQASNFSMLHNELFLNDVVFSSSEIDENIAVSEGLIGFNRIDNDIADETFLSMFTRLGIVLPAFINTTIFQIGVIALSEASVILFSFGFASRLVRKESIWKDFNIYFLIFSIVFVASYNLAGAGGGILSYLLGLFVPVVTVGFALMKGTSLAEKVIEKENQMKRYIEAIEEWEVLSTNPEESDKYQNTLAYALWDKVYSKNKKSLNISDSDIPPMFKQNAVDLEMLKEDWNSTIDNESLVKLDINFQ